MRIIGREDELREAVASLAQPDGAPRALLIRGEPGIGKTTLLRAAVEVIDDGRPVLTSSCVEAEAHAPFCSLRDLLDHPTVTDAFDVLEGPQRRAVREAIRGRAAAPVPRQAVALGSLTLLRAFEEGGITICVDDVQWMDPDSSDVVRFVLRRLHGKVRVIATVGRGGAGEQLALAAAFDEGTTELELGPMSPLDLGSIVAEALGVRLTLAELEELHEASGGRPLFALELARSRKRGSWVDDLLVERIRALPRETRRFLLFASSTPRPHPSVLAEALERDVTVALRRAEREHLAFRSGDAIAFWHPSVPAVAIAAATDIERRDAHRRLAAVATTPEERVRHLAAAADGADGRLARRAEAAARNVERRGAPAEAASLFLLAADLTPDRAQRQRGHRLTAAGLLLARAGRRAEAREVLERAASIVERGDERVQVLTQAALLAGINGEASIEQLREAAAEPASRATHAAALWTLAWEVGFRRDLREGRRIAEKAVRAASGTDPAVIDAARATLQLLSLWSDGRGIDRLRAVPLSDEDRTDRDVAESPTFVAAAAAFYRGDFELARRSLRLLLARARAFQQYGAAGDVLWTIAEMELRAGDLPAARTAILEPELELVTHDVGTGRYMATRGQILAWCGDTDGAIVAAMPVLERSEAADEAYGRVLALWALGVAARFAARERDAAELLSRAWSVARAWGCDEPSAFPFHTDLAESLTACGRLTEADDCLSWLEEVSAARRRRIESATARRARGLWTIACGRRSAGIELLEAARDDLARAGVRLEHARATFALGTAVRAARERRRARELLVEARDVFAGAGALGWVARTERELERVGVRASGPFDLTATEARIAELVAEGRTNREVAVTLFLSPKTVESSLTSIYRKLGVRSRTELARALVRGTTGVSPMRTVG